jgi:hypothetical protein
LAYEIGAGVPSAERAVPGVLTHPVLPQFGQEPGLEEAMDDDARETASSRVFDIVVDWREVLGSTGILMKLQWCRGVDANG